MADITFMTDKPSEKDVLKHKDIKIAHYDVSPVRIKNKWLRHLIIDFK